MFYDIYTPFHPGSSESPPWFRHFEWYSWWENGHIRPAFCIGSPSRQMRMRILRFIHCEPTCVTPVTMLLINVLIVRRHATCFRPPCQTASVILLVFPIINRMSISTWRTFFVSFPLGPETEMTRDLTLMSTPSGISSSSVLRMSRI